MVNDGTVVDDYRPPCPPDGDAGEDTTIFRENACDAAGEDNMIFWVNTRDAVRSLQRIASDSASSTAKFDIQRIELLSTWLHTNTRTHARWLHTNTRTHTSVSS